MDEMPFVIYCHACDTALAQTSIGRRERRVFESHDHGVVVNFFRPSDSAWASRFVPAGELVIVERT